MRSISVAATKFASNSARMLSGRSTCTDGTHSCAALTDQRRRRFANPTFSVRHGRRKSLEPPVPTRDVDAAAMVARALRDPVTLVPAPLDVAALIAAASRHRVLLLLGWKLRAAGTLSDWAAEVIAGFQHAEREAIIVDCIRHAELASVLTELTAAGVRALVVKGAALAHTHYPAPHVRVRADTDLVIAASDLRALEDVLGRLEYIHPPET